MDYDTVTETVYNGTTAVGSTILTFSVPDNFHINTTGFLNASEAGPFELNQYHLTGESLTYYTARIIKKV